MNEALKTLEKEIGFDYVMESHRGPGYYDFIVSMGGDVCRFRVYEDGSIYEK